MTKPEVVRQTHDEKETARKDAQAEFSNSCVGGSGIARGTGSTVLDGPVEALVLRGA